MFLTNDLGESDRVQRRRYARDDTERCCAWLGLATFAQISDMRSTHTRVAVIMHQPNATFEETSVKEVLNQERPAIT
jgi:hypothetical protein